MHVSFLSYLVDPQSHEPLELTATARQGDFIQEGSLQSSTNRYPIVRGIPRFAGYDETYNYARTFGYQWNRWPRVQFDSENVGKPMQDHTRKMWERITGVTTSDLGSAVIAEFGCGPGRFLETIRKKNGRAIGLDYSAAVEAARKNFPNDPDVLIVQGDALRSPLRRDALDGAYSIGVLMATPDPQRGFDEMVKVVRPGGWLSVFVYGQGSAYDLPIVTRYRKLFKALWPVFGHYPPLLYAFLTSHILGPCHKVRGLSRLVSLMGRIIPFASLPDRDWAYLDTFDLVTPTYQSTHESYEVFQWLKQSGLIEIEPTNWGFTAYRGTKPLRNAPSPPEA